MNPPAVPSTLTFCSAILGGIVWLGSLGFSAGDVFDDLDTALNRISVGDPEVEAYFQREGPKGIATADLDGDGHLDLTVSNLDATVTLLFGDGKGAFPDSRHLDTGGRSLRGIVVGRFTIDGNVSILTADPFLGVIHTFQRKEGRTFEAGPDIQTWEGARDLITGDFDNDSAPELIVAGPNKGIMLMRPNISSVPESPWFVEDQVIDTLNEFSDVGTSEWVRNRRPVYALATMPGPEGDRLLVSHARTSEIHILGGTSLEERGRLYQTSGSTHALKLGQLVGSTSPDLVVVSHDENEVRIFAGQDAPPYFESEPAVILPTEGLARDVIITDINADGQNDLALVLRDVNLLEIYQNTDSSFRLVSQSVLGVSPRKAVVGHFDTDAHLDLAIINRQSADVSTLRGTEGPGWETPDIYDSAADAIAYVQVVDLNQDGLDDRLFATQTSGQLGVSFSQPESQLGEWRLYDMGGRITSLSIADVNGDGIPDILTTLWKEASQSSVAIRYGSFEEHFEESLQWQAPSTSQAYLLGVEAIDVDGDSDLDLLLLTQDGRINLVEQTAPNSFAERRVHPLLGNPQDLQVQDLDGDEDLDLALLGLGGEVALLENKQDWLSEILQPTIVETGEIGASNLAFQESGQQLLVGNRRILSFQHLGEGFQFEIQERGSGLGPRSHLTTLAEGLASLTSIGGQLAIEQLSEEATPARKLSIPHTTTLASGDLDGDGQADLIGGGDHVWTVLSSRQLPIQDLPQKLRQADRAPGGVVINEIMAWNKTYQLPQHTSGNPDWLELYNGTPEAIRLEGWTLRLSKNAEEPAVLDYRFPSDAVLAPNGHLVLVCSVNETTAHHTGFNLPKEGGELYLINSEEEPVDEIIYESQQRDQAYARTVDGGDAFHFVALASPGRSNASPSNHLPLNVSEFQVTALGPNSPIQFKLTLENPTEARAVAIQLKISTSATTHQLERVLLDDAGLNGVFQGSWPAGIPQDALLEYFIEIRNHAFESTIYPQAPFFAREDEPITNFTLAWSSNRATGLQISEIVSRNTGGIVDAQGERSDWVEVRNASYEAVSLGAYGLSQSLAATEDKHFRFPADMVLEPGGYLIIRLDGEGIDTPLHAPFRMKSSGEPLLLTHERESGITEIVENLIVPRLTPDQSYARIGVDPHFIVTSPTPLRPNGPPGVTILPNDQGYLLKVVPLTLSQSVLESSSDLAPNTWEPVHQPIPGIEFDFLVPHQQNQAFFRLRELE